MQELSIRNARIVTADAVVDGTVKLRDGIIAAVDSGPAAPADAIDFGGDYLLPGLVELHTDNLEKHLQPRPGVFWPNAVASICAHDLQVAGAGITTVYDAISVGEYREDSGRKELLPKAVAAIKRARDEGLLRAEHLLHLRCEVGDSQVVAMFEPFADDPLVQLVSLMDHTPGQRQWRDMASFKRFHQERGLTDAEFRAEIETRRISQARYADRHRQQIIALVRDRDIPLASHDDTTEEHVEEAHAAGMTISEFPCSTVAAHKARARDMGIIMGAPNVVRGGSHSGNVSALELGGLGLLDGLSSDYVPASLIHAAFVLVDRLGFSMPDAVATVTRNPARMARLDDRGEIAVGKRADLVRVGVIDDLPVVRTTWREGRQVV
ncbi:alpha-D-ribose 1-methylphosphonate 5-triphosphate diphosphatase [Oceanibacterium hippocampi]|uniref:Alpha-D-ribose 1-methylphosphonate 5-triphosphate diphosphatase n=1 Tax=Oceanibacterium hippocampi TaxID=745714 RepID=A0A1Y5U393_9PROT|nr:alpha-D-ribose 1-methylphosphonate 5-triphosphate diphosphatase [Oceanibacterium hippocampi]SLN76117.1 Alpha-D-ribose 1-methylphosphonate 5-triphosphate diphosphatase [Oceanibacterium hippocampi]